MGCWDVFCFICGNPCNTSFDIEYMRESIDKNTKSKNNSLNKNIKSKLIIDKEIKEFYKNTQWMNKCSILLANNRVIHNVSEIACNVIFSDKKISVEHISSLDNNLFNYPYGIFIHTACLKYIKTHYKIDLKFSYLPPVIPSKNKLFDIKYGDIEKYWEQQFNFIDIVLHNKKYLCSNPLKNDKNIAQIKKNISKLKFKNDPIRKGPNVSASFFVEGTIKIGNNKKFWIKKGNKWIEMNEKLINIKIDIDFSKLSKKQQSYIGKLPFIGEFNTEPIFIVDVSHKKNKYTIKLILAESYKDNLHFFI